MAFYLKPGVYYSEEVLEEIEVLDKIEHENGMVSLCTHDQNGDRFWLPPMKKSTYASTKRS